MKTKSNICLVFLLVTSFVSLIGCSSVRTGTTKLVTAPIGLAREVLGGLRPDTSSIEVTEDIPIFLVSGRNLLDSPKGVDPFGNKRSEQPTPHVAIAKVGVGEGLSSDQIIRETLSSSKGKKKTRFELKSVDVLPPISVDHFSINHSDFNHLDHPWILALRKKLDQSQSRTIKIYVHGYNTRLVTNTEFVAAMNHSFGRDGAVISFEWPSAGNVTAYMADKGNANYSTRVFRGMVANIARIAKADKVVILAHSAGNPIVVNALRQIRLIDGELSPAQLHEKYRISRVVLAAPDMDMMSFFNAVFDRFYEVAEGVVVYSSPGDKVLDMSGKIFKAERLGRAVEGLNPWEKDILTKVPQIEMVDVSVAEQKSKGLGHSYFHSNPWVSSDIGSFVQGISPEKRKLIRQPGEVFWEFPTNFPELVLRDSN